jgi:hypothetical protein
VTVALVLSVWIALSAGLTIFNALLLGTFRHPVLLTCWHQAVSVVLIIAVRVVRPSLFATGDEQQGLPPLTLAKAVRLGLPVAVCQSISLVCGNTAIMYLSLAFCQMIKAFTPASVYASGCLCGTQQWSVPIVKCLGVITFGLMVTSLGEMHFNLLGFVMQFAALIAEGLRINILELRLKAQGYKLNALSSVAVFAPMVAAMLLVCALLFDRSAFNVEQISEVGLGIFSANAFMAFLLNVVIYLAIQCASGLVFSLAGVLKDFLIVAGSCIVQGSPITTTQIIGYCIAVAGLQAYGVVSKSPSDFEGGVLSELFRMAIGAIMSQTFRRVASQSPDAGQKEAATPMSPTTDSTGVGDHSPRDDDEATSDFCKVAYSEAVYGEVVYSAVDSVEQP